MRSVIAPVKNIARFSSALDAVTIHGYREEKMVLVYGETGVGKSTALAYFMNRFNAIYVEASPAWSISTMLRAMVLAAGHLPKRFTADMEMQVVDEMGGKDRPLFIDELNFVIKPGQQTSTRMVDMLHSIHDKSRMPVVMVGTDNIDRKLKLDGQIWRRIEKLVPFSDLDREDLRVVSDSLSEVHVEDDLLDKIYMETQGRMGRIRLALAQVERYAKGKKWEHIDASRWGDRQWHLGK